MTKPAPSSQSMSTVVAPSNMQARVRVQSLSKANTTGVAAWDSSRGLRGRHHQFVGGVCNRGGDVGEGEGPAGAGQGGDGPAQISASSVASRPAEDSGDEAGGEALAGDDVGGVLAGAGFRGLSRSVPPGWSRITGRPWAAAKRWYSPLGSRMAMKRRWPYTARDRPRNALTRALLPEPTSPMTRQLGLVSRPLP